MARLNRPTSSPEAVQPAVDFSRLVARMQSSRQKVVFYDKGQRTERTYATLHRDVTEKCAELRAVGVRPGMRIGILGENSYPWLVLDLACIELRCVSVCFPPAEFKDASHETLARTYGVRLQFASPQFIGIDGVGVPWLLTLDAPVSGSAELRPDDAAGGGNPVAQSDDVLSLVFSSGTSGKLKCLVISRRGTEALIRRFGGLYPFQSDDAILAFLPFATFQQRWMSFAAFWYGFDFQFVDPAMVLRGFKELSPTLFGAPPLFYEMFEKRFYLRPAYQRRAIEWLADAIDALPWATARSVAKRALFAPIHRLLGGRLRLMLTGGAPTAPSTFRLFSMLGFPPFEGYGLTETGYVSINLPGRYRTGTVGKPLVEGSVTTTPDGEILVRIKNPLSLGYLGDEGDNTYRKDGAVATGDIGRLEPDGYLTLTGRKKEIIITAGGYKIHPETLEQGLQTCSDVARAVVLGGAGVAGLPVVVSLHRDDRDARKRVEVAVDALNAKLPKASQLSHVVFTDETFGTDNGLLNRNLKVDRKRVLERFGPFLVHRD